MLFPKALHYTLYSCPIDTQLLSGHKTELFSILLILPLPLLLNELSLSLTLSDLSLIENPLYHPKKQQTKITLQIKCTQTCSSTNNLTITCTTSLLSLSLLSSPLLSQSLSSSPLSLPSFPCHEILNFASLIEHFLLPRITRIYMYMYMHVLTIITQFYIHNNNTHTMFSK